MIENSTIEQAITEQIPDAEIAVEDLTGEGKNFSIRVISDQFKGKPIVRQHQLVYAALGPELKKAMHAIQVHTSVKNP